MTDEGYPRREINWTTSSGALPELWSPPGAEAFTCACCDLPFGAHTEVGPTGKRRSHSRHCDGWMPYRKPAAWTPDPTDGCKVGPGEWHHGKACPNPECVCWCHAPKQLHPTLPTTPSAHCGFPLGDPMVPGPLCPQPAHYVVTAIDEYGRELIELACENHLLDELGTVTVVYPTHPIQVSLTVIDESCWDLGRKAWRGQERLRKHRRAP